MSRKATINVRQAKSMMIALIALVAFFAFVVGVFAPATNSQKQKIMKSQDGYQQIFDRLKPEKKGE